MRFVNCTGHDITYYQGDDVYTFPSEYGQRAREATEERGGKNLGGFLVLKQDSLGIINLPEPKEGVLYIVSSRVFFKTSRKDVVYPNTTSRCKFAADGRVLGITSFIGK
jgi:hypothetical protein